MFGIRTVARSMLASAFVASGLDTLRNPESKQEALSQVGVPIAEMTGLPTEPEKLAQLTGAVQVGAGMLLTFGFFPRLASVALAGSLVPTTLGEHRFWEMPEGAERQAHTSHFLKNAGLFGGLVFAALDTRGRPSMFWSGRKAVGAAASGASAASHKVVDKVRPGN